MRNNNQNFKFGAKIYAKNFFSNQSAKGLGTMLVFSTVGGAVATTIGVVGKAAALGGNILGTVAASTSTIGMTTLAIAAAASTIVAIKALPDAFKDVKPTSKIAAGILTAALATTAVTGGLSYATGNSAIKNLSNHQAKKEFNTKVVRKADVLAGDVIIVTPKKSAKLKR